MTTTQHTPRPSTVTAMEWCLALVCAFALSACGGGEPAITNTPAASTSGLTSPRPMPLVTISIQRGSGIR